MAKCHRLHSTALLQHWKLLSRIQKLMHQSEVFAVQPEYRDHALESVVFVLEGCRTVQNMYI